MFKTALESFQMNNVLQESFQKIQAHRLIKLKSFSKNILWKYIQVKKLIMSKHLNFVLTWK